MYDDDNTYDNPGGTFGGSNYSSTGSSDNDPGTGFNTLGNRYSTTWLDPKPFGAQNSEQMSPMSGQLPYAHDWLKRDTDPPVAARTLEMRGPEAWEGATRHLTMGDIAHLPESRQYMMIKTSAPKSEEIPRGPQPKRVIYGDGPDWPQRKLSDEEKKSVGHGSAIAGAIAGGTVGLGITPGPLPFKIGGGILGALTGAGGLPNISSAVTDWGDPSIPDLNAFYVNKQDITRMEKVLDDEVKRINSIKEKSFDDYRD